VDIPVIAGGGIGDGRGLMAALSLGAEGVYMGTRFIATRECPAHPRAKELILATPDTGTISLRHGAPSPAVDDATGNRGFVEERRGSIRLVINDYLRRVMADGKFSYDEIFGKASSADPGKKSNRTVDSYIWGKLENTSISAGQISGMIRDLPTCQELVERMVGEAEAVLKRLRGFHAE